MKRILLILLSIMLLLTATACGQPSEEDQVKNAVSAYLKEILNDPLSAADPNGSAVAEEYGDIRSIVNAMLKRTEYEITGVTIDQDRATAKVQFSSYDLGKSFNDMVEVYFDALLAAYATTGSFEDIDSLAILAESWRKTLGEQEELGKTRITPFTMEVQKTADGWKVSDCLSNNEFLDILSGGILSAYGQLDE